MEKSAVMLGLSYALCVLSGMSVLLSVALAILVAIHRQLAKESAMKYVRHGTILMTLANVTANVGVILLMLWNGVDDRLYCESGGFLLLFGVLESVWILLICAVCLMIQMRTKLMGGNPFARLRERWNVPIFLLSFLLKAVVLAMLVFLALTKVRFFTDSSTDCTMLVTMGAASWQYSASVVCIAWTAIVPATVISLCSVFTSGSSADAIHRNRKFIRASGKFSHWTAVVGLVNSLLWIIVLMVSTVVVFSGNDIIDPDYMNVALGYVVTVTIMIGTIVAIVVLVASRRWRHCNLNDLTDRNVILCGKPPDSLVSLTKLPSQKDDVHRYLIHWFSDQKTLLSGVMKVYPLTSITRWRSEINAIAKVSEANHPNLAKYMWECGRNKFAPQICTFAGDLLSPECSITCMQHYPHGTLGGYLKTRSHMTEVGLYNVTLDVARGLGFIHQNHLVHNALTTETIYMSSLAGKIGLRAVIGDFESSYEVSENTLRKSPLMVDRSHILDSCSLGSLYSISQQLDMENNKFAPDIRSFGMVVLEMLMALGEFDEHSDVGIHYRSGDARRNSAYDNASVDSVESQPAAARRPVQAEHGAARQHRRMGSDPSLPGRRAECDCSPRVTDIRAVKCRSLEATSMRVPNGAGTPGGGRSAFTPPKFAEPAERADKPPTARPADCAAPARRTSDVQNRDLPPLPPKDVKSPRRYRSANQKPAHHQQQVRQNEQMSPPSAKLSPPSARTPLSVAVDEASDPRTNPTGDFSPSGDPDFYSLSVGSLGSFETIYEDEERASSRGQYGASPQSRTGRTTLVSKPPVLKRKLAECESQKRRYSVASANDSVFSIDSGIGSYSSDTYSETSGQTYGQRSWLDTHRGSKRLDSPDLAPVLHVRKKPCSKHHPEPVHRCSSSEPSSDSGRTRSDRAFGNSCQTDSSTSATDTMSSDEPMYETVSPPRRRQTSANAERRVPQLGPQMAPLDVAKLGDPLSAHPAIRQQYRYAVPRLGVSAVLARRLSDTSLSSLTSCSTHRSQDVADGGADGAKAAKQPRSRPTSATRTTTTPPDGGRHLGDESAALSSSVLSIIRDSKMLLDDPSDGGANRLAPRPFSVSRPPRGRRPRSEIRTRSGNMDHSGIARLLADADLDPKEKGRLLNILKLINGNDKLGIIGQQMMTLFSDCWLEDPVPSADELFQRLNLVLPTAVV